MLRVALLFEAAARSGLCSARPVPLEAARVPPTPATSFALQDRLARPVARQRVASDPYGRCALVHCYEGLAKVVQCERSWGERVSTLRLPDGGEVLDMAFVWGSPPPAPPLPPRPPPSPVLTCVATLFEHGRDDHARHAVVVHQEDVHVGGGEAGGWWGWGGV